MIIDGHKKSVLKIIIVAACAAVIITIVLMKVSGSAALSLNLFKTMSNDLAIPSGFAERFEPYSTDKPDERWDGCFLTGVSATPVKAIFEFECGDDGIVSLALVPASKNGYNLDAENGSSRRVTILSGKLKSIIAGMSADGQVMFVPEEESLTVFALTVFLATVVVGIFLLLFFTGSLSGFAFSRDDWPALAILVLALAVRLLLPIRSASEIMTYFPSENLKEFFSDKHSITYAGYKYLLLSFFGTSHEVLFVSNILLGALTTAVIYLFMRDLFDRRSAALAAALFSFQPVLVRFSATDAHMSFLFFTFIAGVWLASFGNRGWISVFSGMVFLGLAGSCRIEGLLYLALGVVIIAGAGGLKRLCADRIAAASGFIFAALLIAVQYCLKMKNWSEDLGLGRHGWLGRVELGELTNAIRFVFSGSGWSTTAFQLAAITGVAFSLVFAIYPKLKQKAFSRPAYTAAKACVFATGAFIASFLLVAIYKVSYNAVTAHRFYIPFALISLAAAPGLSEIAGFFRSKLLQKAFVSGVVAALFIGLLFNMDRLQELYTFNVEYSMLHAQLGSSKNCSLLYFSGYGDRGIHNPDSVVPNVTLVDGSNADCVSYARSHECVYYMRGTSCSYCEVFKAECGQVRGNQPDVAAMCRNLESALDLEPVEEHFARLGKTFRAKSEEYAEKDLVKIGLYRVKGARSRAISNPERN